jgi:hypothetical protein
LKENYAEKAVHSTAGVGVLKQGGNPIELVSHPLLGNIDLKQIHSRLKLFSGGHPHLYKN